MEAEGRRSRTERRLLAAGAVGCLAALALVGLVSGAAWRAWLAAAVLWSAAPIGAVVLVMIMRLVPGDWAEELAPSTEAVALLAPGAALLLAPALLAYGAIYGWAHEPLTTEFRRAYFEPGFFLARSAIFLLLLSGLAGLLVVWRRSAATVSSLGLILFVVLGGVAATDWLLSIDPDFSSSGFGLYILCIQVLQGLALAIAATLIAGPVARPGYLGGVLLTLLLLWGYFAFMHYFVTWSDNLPPGVRWYHTHNQGSWSVLMWVAAACRLCPAFLLFFAYFRAQRWPLLILAGVVAVGAAAEAAWLALPARPDLPAAGPTDLAVYALSVVAIGVLGIGLYPRTLAWRARRLSR